MITFLVFPELEPWASTAWTTSIPLVTLPKTTWAPSSQSVLTVVRKNCEPLLEENNFSFDQREEKREVSTKDVRVRAGVGHGEDTGASMLQGEVLISELLAVDGLATSAVEVGEVTTLKHEIGDDTVEDRAGVTEALLASAESSEVLSGLGDLVGVKLHLDTASRLWGDN